MMNILVVQETDWVDRNPILHHRMLELLSLRGEKITVIDFDILWHQKGRFPLWQPRWETKDIHKFFADSTITLIRPPMLRMPGLGRLSWNIANWPELRRLFQQQKPDIVVAYSISNALLALKLARRHGVPFVFHVLEALHTHAEPALQPIARAVERAVMRRADKVIVVNTRLKTYAVQMGANPSLVDVIPMGADISPLSPARGKEQRASLGLTESDLVMLYLGWLYPASGLKELILEFARRQNNMPRLKFLIVGDGDLLPELKRLRDEHGLSESVILTGRRPASEMPAYLAASDIGLWPAHKSTIMEHLVPTKVIDYMERGKPVIATRLPGLETEFGTLPGILYIEKPEETLDRAETLLQQEDPRESARQLGLTCLERMRERESWEEVTERFGRLLESVIPVPQSH